MQRRKLLRAAAALGPLSVLGSVATAQTQPIKVVVGFAPGGSVDALARLVAESLQSGLNRTAIVDNRAGAAGRLAVELVKAAPPDGDTLLVAPQGPMTLFPYVFRNLRYDPTQDFVPVTRLASGDFALTIGPMVPAKDMKGFRAWLATAGDKAAYGSPGAGTIPHFIGVAFARQIGVPMTHVPYRGSALSMNDLAGGTLAMAVSPVTEALELHKAGRVTIIATAGASRSPFVQGVPTLKELGYRIVASSPYGLVGPRGLPPHVVQVLHDAFKAAMFDPQHVAELAKYDQQLAYLGPEDYGRSMREAYAAERLVVEKLGLAKKP